MKIKKLLILLFLVAFPVSSVSGCTPKRYRDIADSISWQSLKTPEGEYESITWLDENRIAFIYRPQELVGNGLDQDFRIGIFEISSGKSKDLPLPDLASQCSSKPGGVSELNKVPNGSLGFMSSCRLGEAALYLLDPDTEVLTKWNSYYGILARSFSFSPDMEQLVQEDGSGGGLSEKLLLVSSDKTVKELLPDFQRARSPAWSLDGKMIVFAGNKENPENAEPLTWKGIEDLFFYPWDIYVTDADWSNPRILLPLVGTVYDLKWSPVDENLILFGGTSFDNKDGIWLLNTTDFSVKRIWTKNTSYDWSPVGTKIAVLDNRVDIWWSSITIIDIGAQ